MKQVKRIVLFIIALIVGGVLAKLFLFEGATLGWLLFIASCAVLGEVFYQIDKRL